jgi:hypothetical protein
MAKQLHETTSPQLQALTVECLCGGDEMICAGKVTFKGFRKFFCETCHSTLWVSPAAFEEADKVNKIMER